MKQEKSEEPPLSETRSQSRRKEAASHGASIYSGTRDVTVKNNRVTVLADENVEAATRSVAGNLYMIAPNGISRFCSKATLGRQTRSTCDSGNR